MPDDLPTDPAIHDRQGFECGVPALDEYIGRIAERHHRSGISSVYVLTDSAQPELILGYYTLSAAEVDGQRTSDAKHKRFPRYPVPCFRMGRLACRSDQRGRGLDQLLLGCAVDRCLKAPTADCSSRFARGCERRRLQSLPHAFRIQDAAGRAPDAVLAVGAMAQYIGTRGATVWSGPWRRHLPDHQEAVERYGAGVSILAGAGRRPIRAGWPWPNPTRPWTTGIAVRAHRAPPASR